MTNYGYQFFGKNVKHSATKFQQGINMKYINSVIEMGPNLFDPELLKAAQDFGVLNDTCSFSKLKLLPERYQVKNFKYDVVECCDYLHCVYGEIDGYVVQLNYEPLENAKSIDEADLKVWLTRDFLKSELMTQAIDLPFQEGANDY